MVAVETRDCPFKAEECPLMKGNSVKVCKPLYQNDQLRRNDSPIARGLTMHLKGTISLAVNLTKKHSLV